MLDIHTHILPDMDDGSKSLKQSAIMLRREARQGIDRVVLTPHFYAHRESPESFLKRRDASVQALEQLVANRNMMPDRFQGAEVAYFVGMSRSEVIEKLCIGTTRAILVEMPFDRWNRSIIEELTFLKENRNIRPVLAHVERYMRFQPMGTIAQLCEAGIWIQANTSFFMNWQTSWMAMRMLKARKIQFVGSDCHNTKNRPPNLGVAIDKIGMKLGMDAIDYLESMERRLLAGDWR